MTLGGVPLAPPYVIPATGAQQRWQVIINQPELFSKPIEEGGWGDRPQLVFQNIDNPEAPLIKPQTMWYPDMNAPQSLFGGRAAAASTTNIELKYIEDSNGNIVHIF